MSEKTVEYPGKEVDVRWDGKLCIHVGECGRAKGDLFIGGRNPWCQPDLVDNDEVLDVIKRCPSGALTCHTRTGLQPETANSENTMHVTHNGPLFLNGDLAIENAPEDAPGLAFRAALCRCGQSKNKPYCDNSHVKADFRDSGAVGESGSKLEERGGKLSIKPVPDGPLQINGNLTISAGSGRESWQGTKTWLCRCGESKNKPFCDGSHKKAGFKST